MKVFIWKDLSDTGKAVNETGILIIVAPSLKAAKDMLPEDRAYLKDKRPNVLETPCLFSHRTYTGKK